jgi:hypothetical protein
MSPEIMCWHRAGSQQQVHLDETLESIVRQGCLITCKMAAGNFARGMNGFGSEVAIAPLDKNAVQRSAQYRILVGILYNFWIGGNRE